MLGQIPLQTPMKPRLQDELCPHPRSPQVALFLHSQPSSLLAPFFTVTTPLAANNTEIMCTDELWQRTCIKLGFKYCWKRVCTVVLSAWEGEAGVMGRPDCGGAFCTI